MSSVLMPPAARPNRLYKEDGKTAQVKDKKYHVDYARWCVYSGMYHPFQESFLMSNYIFWNFYKGNQWIFTEDLGAFLTDEDYGARNRIKFTDNVIKRLVEQWIGSANRMQFNAKAVNISPYAKTRKEEKIAEMVMLTKVANLMGGGVKQQMQDQYGLGETENETKELYDNYYVDEFTRGINALLRWSKDRNKFNNSIIDLTTFMAITGMAIHKGYELNQDQAWEVIDPNRFFFDRACKYSDLRDASFMGEYNYSTAPDIFEKCHTLNSAQREAIENFTRSNMSEMYAPIYQWMGSTRDRVINYTSVWKDVEEQTFGYVIDKYGDEFLTQINVRDEDGKLKADSYTEKDLIIPKRENYKKFLEGKKKRTMYVDVLRYCEFVPKEVCGADGEDIVLEYGIVPYQQTNALDPSSVEFPYKVQCWLYHNGEVISPIQDAISPQRMLNRSLSATESILNNARGSGTVIDENAVDAQDQSEIYRNINLSKPITVNTKGLGVQNVVGTYGSNLGNNLNPFIGYVDMMRSITQNVTGFNEAMLGEGGRSGDLVGVKNLEVQRGSLVQEKFYFKIEDVMLQTFQAVASQGKRIYADSPRRLAMIVGDDCAEDLIISKEMDMEEFRVFIHRAIPDDQEKEKAMATALQLFQFGLLGDKQVEKLFRDGDLEMVGALMAQYAQEKNMMSKMQQKTQQGQEQQGMAVVQQAKQEQQQQQQIGLSEAAKERQLQLQKIALKESYKTGHIREQNDGKIATQLLQNAHDAVHGNKKH